MKIMRAFITTLALLASLPILYGASRVEWLAESYDFGTFHEANGPKTGSVAFVNKGPEPTIINRVRPSCGCTGASFTEGIIMPGDTARISFTYNPIGRPGRFEKTVKVFYGEENAMKVIPISGTVIGTPETLNSDYPAVAGGLRLSDSRILAGAVTYGKSRNLFMRGYNQSNDTIRPVWTCDNPALSIGISTPAIAPGEVASFSFYFNTRDINEPGPLSIPVTFRPSEGAEDSFTVNFMADVMADTSAISPLEAKKGARIYVVPDLVDLGIVKGSKELKRDITITNEGQTDLIIKRIYCDRDGIRATRYPSKVPPGKSNKITVTVRADLLPEGPSASSLDIYSNDPVHPVKSVRIAAIRE